MSQNEPLIFFYDYVDPASWLMETWLRAEGFVPGEDLLLLPFEINPPPNPLLDPEGELLATRWEAVSREGGELAVDLRRPSMVPWSRKAHELAFHAAEFDSVAEIHEALFQAYLIEGRDLGRVDVLTALAAEHGLETGKTKVALDVDRHAQTVQDIRSKGLREGVEVPPTLLRFPPGALRRGDEGGEPPGVEGEFLRLSGPQTLETLRGFLRGVSDIPQP